LRLQQDNEHKEHLREMLNRLQTARFTFNKDKVVLGASEIKYLGTICQQGDPSNS
jgi:hypothetical protein